MKYELDRTLQFNDLDEFFNSKEYTKMLINDEIYRYEYFAEYVNVKIFKKVNQEKKEQKIEQEKLIFMIKTNECLKTETNKIAFMLGYAESNEKLNREDILEILKKILYGEI